MHKNCGEFVGGQWSVLLGESNLALELRVTGDAFFDARHADQDDSHVVSVEEVADLLEAGCFETACFVDDEQLGAAAGAGFIVGIGIDDTMLGALDRRGELSARSWEALVDLTDGSSDSRGEECGAGVRDALGSGARSSEKMDCHCSQSSAAV